MEAARCEGAFGLVGVRGRGRMVTSPFRARGGELRTSPLKLECQKGKRQRVTRPVKKTYRAPGQRCGPCPLTPSLARGEHARDGAGAGEEGSDEPLHLSVNTSVPRGTEKRAFVRLGPSRHPFTRHPKKGLLWGTISTRPVPSGSHATGILCPRHRDPAGRLPSLRPLFCASMGTPRCYLRPAVSVGGARGPAQGWVPGLGVGVPSRLRTGRTQHTSALRAGVPP